MTVIAYFCYKILGFIIHLHRYNPKIQVFAFFFIFHDHFIETIPSSIYPDFSKNNYHTNFC